MKVWSGLGFVFVMLNIGLTGAELTYFGADQTAAIANVVPEVTEIEAGGIWSMLRLAPGWFGTVIAWLAWDYSVFYGSFAIIRIILFCMFSIPALIVLASLFFQAAQGLLGAVSRLSPF